MTLGLEPASFHGSPVLGRIWRTGTLADVTGGDDTRQTPLTLEETEYLGEGSWDQAQKQGNEQGSPLLSLQ